MSFICAHILYALICHSYVSLIYSYVIRMPLACTRMSLLCTRMSSVCHSYVLVCHLYVTHMWFSHEPILNLKKNWFQDHIIPRVKMMLSQEYKFDKICGIIFWKIWTCLKRFFLFIPSLSHNLKEKRALSNNCVAISND